MPVDSTVLTWLNRAMTGPRGQRGVLSERELTQLLRRVAASDEPAATARACASMIGGFLRHDAIDLTGTRRARLHQGLVELFLLAGEAPPTPPGGDLVDALKVVPGPSAPPAAALVSPDGRHLLVGGVPVGDGPDEALARCAALLALPAPPPALAPWLHHAAMAAPAREGDGRVACAAASLLAARALAAVGRLPDAAREELALAAETGPHPAVAAWLRRAVGAGPVAGDDALLTRVDALAAGALLEGVRLPLEERWWALGAVALAGDPGAVDTFDAALTAAAAGGADPDALRAVVLGYVQATDAVSLSFGNLDAAFQRAAAARAAADATAAWLRGPNATLLADPPRLGAMPLGPYAAEVTRRAVAMVRDAAGAHALAAAVARAHAVVGLPGPMGGTAAALLDRALAGPAAAADGDPDGRADLSGLPEAVTALGQALGADLRAWLAGLGAEPPVARAGDVALVVSPSLTPLLREIAVERVGSERSLPNVAAALQAFADAGEVDAAAFARFLDGYLAAWPHLRTFDFNKLARLARAARRGNPTPLCRINGAAIDPGTFHADVGRTVAAALAGVPFPHAWMAHRFGYRARQAAELVDLLAERAAQGRGPLAALRLLHPGAVVQVAATTSDMEYNALVYTVDHAQGRTVYYMDSDGAVHVHARHPEPGHVLFTAEVDPDGHVHVRVPDALPVSPRAYPLMNTYGLGDRIDVELFDADAALRLVERERFETRYTVQHGTIVAFDDVGRHRVIVDTPAGPVERTYGFDQIRGWNNPHVVDELDGEACTVRFDRRVDARFADDLAAMTALAEEHGLPLFDLAWSEARLATAQKAFLRALNDFARRTLRYPASPPRDDADRAFDERLSSGTHPMGAYLEVQRGVCRHQFVRAHMGKQRAGIDERFASGAANTYEGAFRGLHIWGEVSLADRSRLVADEPDDAEARYLSDATWGDAWVPLWGSAYGNDLRRVEMYDRTRNYAHLMVRSAI